jgi:hypothetical protein
MGTASGVVLANAILLVYGLFRPNSLEFSIPFLIAPSLALLWSVCHRGTERGRRVALFVSLGVVVGTALVAAVALIRD